MKQHYKTDIKNKGPPGSGSKQLTVLKLEYTAPAVTPHPRSVYAGN